MAYLDFIDPGNAGGSVPAIDSPFEGIGFKVITYPCAICGQIFDSQDALFEHRFQNHPFKRPTLLLSGIEITSPRQLVVSQLSAGEIAFWNVSKCFLNSNLIDIDELKGHLIGKTRGLCTIRLENDGVESAYQLDFDVPDDSELIQVEQTFFETVGGSVLDLGRIDLFIDMTSRYESAKRYVDGLSNYLYGILAKDQRGGTQLEQADFTIKFNQALDTLRLLDRALAKAVVGVVNFNQNVFVASGGLDAAPKAQSAMLKFNGMVTGSEEPKGPRKPTISNNYKKIPLDYATEKIFDWALMPLDEMLKNRKELEYFLKSVECVANDKFKVQMLLAELMVSVRDFSTAIRLAGGFTNDTVFGPWAQRIIGAKE